ncbi:hypothetical protein ACEUZ9_002754 [Paracoccus litorisediminis]|uniref:hypothetical protein n=1 Tax=Paracoccus litorisediminis TaxID=2006130 RepID=UPI00372FD4F1
MNKVISLNQHGRPRNRIRIIDGGDARISLESLHDPRAYVTIGPGETHVSIMDDEGESPKKWVAIFGWSYLFNIPLRIGEKTIFLEEPDTISRALRGAMKIYGEMVDTGAWRQDASTVLADSLDEILIGTIGSGAQYSGIVLAAPDWMHDILQGSIGIRPHILKTIREI